MAPSSSKTAKPSFRNLQKPSKKTFKSKPKSNGKSSANDAVVSQREAASLHLLQLEDDVPDFPRGGGSSLSRHELEDVRAVVDAEFEAEERVSKKNKRQKKLEWRSQSAEDDLGSLFGDAFTGKLPRFANRITLKNISPGMKLWGVISEVNEKDIVVSLPGGLRGLVRASEAFDPLPINGIKGDVESAFLSSIYHVGQLVSCIVQQVDDDKKETGKRRIWLSLRLSLLHKGLIIDVIQEGMVLSAYVKSIEDHGYMLHFGLASFTGFMPKSNQSEGRDIEVKAGQLIQGVVKSIDKTRKLLYVNSDPDMVSKSVTKDLKGISIDLLVPGMMVDARVRSSLENGIMLSFLTYFTGTVDIFNLNETFPASNWKDCYSLNKKVNARILFIDPSTRAVGLTLNPHLVHNRAPPTLVQTGDIFDQSKIIRIDRGSGLLLEIPSSPVPTPAYVSVSDVADKEVKKLEKSFKEGSLVRVRVLGCRHLEGLATGILKKKENVAEALLPSTIKNKAKRSEVHAKLKHQKKIDKRKTAKAREAAEKRALELGEEPPAKKIPRTIENTREFDETICKPDDEELFAGNDADEFNSVLKQDRTPKILITTCRFNSTRGPAFISDLLSVIPNAHYFKRGTYDLKKIVEYAKNKDFTSLIVVHTNRREPDALLIIALPEGPTAYFKLSKLRLRKDIKNHGNPTSHKPELVLNNFTTRLGHRIGRLIQSVFPQDPNFRGRRVVTFHNQRDFIFFRHHRYIFETKENKQAASSGKMVKENKDEESTQQKVIARLQECGPRFTLKLISLQHGTFDSKAGEYEWVHKPEMDTSRRRFFL